MSDDKSAPELPPGFLIWPSVKGHRPPKSLKRLLLPDPLGPVTRMLLPGDTCAQCQHASLQPAVECPGTRDRDLFAIADEQSHVAEV